MSGPLGRPILGEIKMKKALVVGLAVAGLAGQAYAGDWVPPKVPDPIPDNLTWYGITPIGALDLGYANQTNGRPLGNVVSGLEFIPFTTTRNYTGQAISTIAHSGLQQSFIGVTVVEPLGAGWKAVARADTGFDPLTGNLSNGCNSFLQNAGLVYTQQNSNADSGRCGQPLNGVLWGGISNAQYGTLTFGRQNSFQLDGIAAYDPLSLSYAFSLLGYSGTDGGSGSTQAARWDNSAKYVYDFGPITAGAMYAGGDSGAGFFNNAYGFMFGGHVGGFSAEAVWTKEHGAVNLQTAVNDVVGSTTLAANISDNTEWSIMGKYTWELGRPAAPAYPYPTKAAVKAAPPPVGDKFSIYAGYTNISQANPVAPVLFGDAAGGFPLTSSATLPDNNAFTTAKILQIYWAGAKYEFAWGLNLTGAYYHVTQNQYIADGAACTLGGASKTDCAGIFDQVSFVADYWLNKHMDVYAGITYGRASNGLASGFPGTPGAKFGFAGTNTSVDTTSFMTGLRIKI
jgi:predicted porin